MEITELPFKVIITRASGACATEGVHQPIKATTIPGPCLYSHREARHDTAGEPHILAKYYLDGEQRIYLIEEK